MLWLFLRENRLVFVDQCDIEKSTLPLEFNFELKMSEVKKATENVDFSSIFVIRKVFRMLKSYTMYFCFPEL